MYVENGSKYVESTHKYLTRHFSGQEIFGMCSWVQICLIPFSTMSMSTLYAPLGSLFQAPRVNCESISSIYISACRPSNSQAGMNAKIQHQLQRSPMKVNSSNGKICNHAIPTIFWAANASLPPWLPSKNPLDPTMPS